MVEALVARQPVFDRHLEVVGYELLFRRAGEDVARISDHDDATATVVLNTFTEIGLDTVVGEAPAWINVSRSFLLDRLAMALPPERVTLEILEGQAVDDRLLEGVRALRDAGYRLVLDDFTFDESRIPLIELADAVKLDLVTLGLEGAARQVELLRPFDVRLLAEKVETQSDYRHCRDLGFDLFQGYFFCKPEVVSGRGIGPNRLSLLQLVAAVQDPAIEFAQLEKLITRDVGLSYRLLRYINSAFFGLRKQVDSINRALVLLGLENIRRWATMTILAQVDEKPRELIVTALVRARLCELLGPSFGEPDGDQLFTLGLFSVVDALMDAPMDEVLRSLPFPRALVAALCEHEGTMGRVLATALGCERGDLDMSRCPVATSTVAELHLQAVSWAGRAAREVLSPMGELGDGARAAA